MIAVIFEVMPHDDQKSNYLELAATMRETLETVDGFISVERFQSLTDPSKLLSLSFFEDEEALNHWRRLTTHRKAQSKGRNEYFADYRLRVCSVIRDYGMTEREQAPQDSKSIHDNP